MPLVTDVSLARRLERAEGATNAAFVEARRRMDAASGAEWRELGGTYAMFDGAESPITQTFGLGLFSAPTNDMLGELESFFAERGAPTMHETCPLADMALLSLLPERGYRPVEQSSVLHCELTESSIPVHRSELHVRRIDPGEAELWADTSMRGWGDVPGVADFVRAFGLISATSDGMHCFLAERDGTPVAAAGLAMHERVALLAGASTIPEWRGQGAQSALLAARLHHAMQAGCDVAMMAAQPGSGSQRNAERQGFRIGYTRTKWGLMR